MRTIYIDDEFKCHVTHDGARTPVETDFFDGKCAAYVEGYRYVPAGESWTDPAGNVYHGEMIVAWKPYAELDAAQREYERQLLAEYAEALKVVGVDV